MNMRESSGGGYWHKLPRQLLGQPPERTLFGISNLLFVVRQPTLDIVVALDHHAPERGRQFACLRLGG